MSDEADEITLPLVAESAAITRRSVAAGRVAVTTRTTTSVVSVDEELVAENVVVERVPIRRFVDQPPPVRTDGDDTIVPVIEEVVVTRLFLKEEVRLRRVRTTRRHQEQLMVREQEAVITRRPAFASPQVADHPFPNKNEETTMPSETILAVFETEAEAERAIAALEREGVPRTAIEHYGRQAGVGATVPDVPTGAGLGRDQGEGFGLGQETTIGTEPPRRGGFWSWITGEPAAASDKDDVAGHGDYYDRTIEHGRTIVTVVTESVEAERILSVLEAHSPVELEEHGAGTAGFGTMSPGIASPGAMSTSPGTTSTGTAATGTTVPGNFGADPSDEALATPVSPLPPRSGDRIGSEPLATDASREEIAPPVVPPAGGASLTHPTVGSAAGREETVPLAAETLDVGKREIDRGTTRVRRYVVNRPVEEQVRLRDETVSVFRRPASGAAAVAADAFSDRTIEMTETDEEAVVAKKAAVVEEVVIRKDVGERVETVRDNLRSEDVEITGPNGKVEAGRDTPPRV